MNANRSEARLGARTSGSEPVWKLRGALFSGKRPDGATKEALRAATTEQLRKHSRAGRSQTAFSAKTLRAAGLLSVAGGRILALLAVACGGEPPPPPPPPRR